MTVHDHNNVDIPVPTSSPWQRTFKSKAIISDDSGDEVVEQPQEVVPRGTKRKRPIKMIARNGKDNESNEDSALETAGGHQESSSHPSHNLVPHACNAFYKGNVAAGPATTPLVERERNNPKPKMTSMRVPPRGLENEGLKG
ncbi:hypothetical protein F5890DRAFT_1560075 [Lentinula detonsa]|uniref:Uncharacterized protein n=1 Tax=Lentinula detonsa TaxID=2804962 RepID=A0AA38PN04_9AGAR|nr:hypothetical protein F5890DRAFT_1560075 [Lentinula detonsa]